MRSVLPAFALAVALLGDACSEPPATVEVALVATFEAAPDGVVLALYDPREGGTLEVREGATGEVVREISVTTDPERGHTAEVVIEGLAADTGYEVQLLRGDEPGSDVARFRTAPAPASAVDLSFVVAADIDLAFASPILGELAEAPVDFTLLLGDVPYADNPPHAVTLDEYREVHRLLRTDERIRAIVAARSAYAIYDDHELRNDWDAFFREREAERIAAGLAAWDEWFPLRRDDRRYRSVRWGALLEIFILDTRLYRSANADPDGPDKTLLGAEQLAWLQGGLLASDAIFKIVATSVPLDFCEPVDCWATFARERDELIDFIRENRIETVVFLTGDQHFFAVHHYESGLLEVQVGPVARGIPEPRPPAWEESARYFGYNYGEVRAYAGAEPRLELRGRDAEGAELHVEVVRAGIGRIEVGGSGGFELRGAHRFRGQAPAVFDYAPVGRYRLRWDGDAEDAAVFDLLPGETAVLEP